MGAANGKASVSSSTERVKAWLEGQVLHIRFNNPARHNALSVDMWEAVPLLLEQAERDDNVRMVVFSGEGDKAFVSGADISQFEDQRAAKEAVKRYEQLAEAALQGIYEFSKPTVACIRGYCIGGGVNVAISCDIRLASSDAIFAIPATRLGLGYRFSAMKNLTQLVGPGHAKDIFFTARKLDAAEAMRIGDDPDKVPDFFKQLEGAGDVLTVERSLYQADKGSNVKAEYNLEFDNGSGYITFILVPEGDRWRIGKVTYDVERLKQDRGPEA